MKLWELKERYKKGRGGASTQGRWDDDQLKYWFNEAQDALCTELLLLESPLLEVTLIADTTEYALRRTYSTGTVQASSTTVHESTTVSSRSVTIPSSSTDFTSSMVGYYFCMAGDPEGTAWTKIKRFVSAEEIELATPYLGHRTSGASYVAEAKHVYSSVPSWSSSDIWPGWTVDTFASKLSAYASSAVIVDIDYNNGQLYLNRPAGNSGTYTTYAAHINDVVYGGIRSIHVDAVSDGAGGKLDYLPVSEMEQLLVTNTTADPSRPLYYTTFDADEETIIIWPTPDTSQYSTLRVYYYMYPRTMYYDWHELSIPSAFHSLLLDYVDVLAKRNLNEVEKVSLLSAIYKAGEARLSSLRTARQKSEMPYIKSYSEASYGPTRHPRRRPWEFSRYLGVKG